MKEVKIDKSELKTKVMRCYEGLKKRIEDSIKSSTREAIDSPGANVSHSDTNKFNISNVALSKQKPVIAYIIALTELRSLSVDVCETVIIGAVFQLQNLQTEESKFYYLIPSYGGEVIKHAEVEILTISKEAPLATLAAGKEEGDEFRFKDQQYEIKRVW